MFMFSVVFVVVPMCKKESSVFSVCVSLVVGNTHTCTHMHTHNLKDEAAAQQVPSSHSFSDSFLKACEVKDAVFVLR